MELYLSIVVIFACVRTARAHVQVDSDQAPAKARKRLLQMMRGEIEENARRISLTKNMRFMYEESPHYEIGYVFAEVIERYRKQVEVYKRCQERQLTFYHTLFHLETAQFLYFELYHLVMMLHEIPRKYAHNFEFMFLKAYQEDNVKAEDQLTLEQQQEAYMEMLRLEKEQEKRRRRLAMMNARLFILKQFAFKSNARPKNERWPLDYGWEISKKYWDVWHNSSLNAGQGTVTPSTTTTTAAP